MRIFSLIAHPRPTSFCHAVSEGAREELIGLGHAIFHHDLYAEGFNPCLSADEAYSIGESLDHLRAKAEEPLTRQHRSEISSADGLLVIHPNWWGKPPAILAGWLDRVLVPGVAYRLAEADGLPDGLLRIRRALIINTSDTHAEREIHEFGDPLELIWGRCVLPFCGVEAYRRHVFRPVVGSRYEQRSRWLQEAKALCRDLFAPLSDPVP